MNLVGVKLISVGILLILTFLFSTLPIYLLSFFIKRNKTNSIRTNFKLFPSYTFVNFITCFGGGVFLGACLCDLLPEVVSHIDVTLKEKFHYDNHGSNRYPIAETLIGTGIFIVLFIEQLILSLSKYSILSTTSTNKKPTIVMSHEDDETALTNIDDQDPLMNRNISNTKNVDLREYGDNIKTNKNHLIMTRNFILILSLIIHSVFEGIALGASNQHDTFMEIFIAIVIHKSIIAFSVGLKFIYVTNKRLVYLACFLFSIATPVGVLFVLGMQELLPNNHTAAVIREILQAFACGTFFYITFFDVLPHELNMTSHHRQSSSNLSNKYRLLKVLCIFLGFTFIAVLSFNMK